VTELLEVVAKLSVVYAGLAAHIVAICSDELGLRYDLLFLASFKKSLICCLFFVCLKGL
jgi:hypothetical protein